MYEQKLYICIKRLYSYWNGYRAHSAIESN